MSLCRTAQNMMKVDSLKLKPQQKISVLMLISFVSKIMALLDGIFCRLFLEQKSFEVKNVLKARL